MRDKTILFSICSLGLGHATRTLPIIQNYLKKNKILILSDGNALLFLKDKLKKCNVNFFEKKKHYPLLELASNRYEYYFNLTKDSLKMKLALKSEQKQVKKICETEKVDFIISDGNYGSHHKEIPSFLITHQIDFQVKGKLYKTIGNLYNSRTYKKFSHLLILDYPSKNKSLSGNLAHCAKILKRSPHTFVGILSQYKKIKIPETIDYLIIISGFLHRHREEFYNNLLHALKGKKGKKVFIMGDYKKNYSKKIGKDIQIFSSFKNLDQNKLLNQSKVIISRAGYSTLMDMVELEKNALLIPTPYQSEQEYLAEYHKNKKLFNIILNQKNIEIKKIIDYKKNFKKLEKTKASLKKIDKVIKQYLPQKDDN